MHSGLRWIWVSVVILILDRLTKSLAYTFLIYHEPLPVTRFFNLTLAYNKGAAFSFLDGASGWQMWFFGGLALVVSLALLFWLVRLSYQQRWLSIALALVVGGAIGNLCDRFLYGHVIDFIQLYASQYYFPAFNVADSAICIGAFMLFWDAAVKKKS